MEGKEWVWSNGAVVERDISDMHKTMVEAPSKELMETKIKLFKNFMSKL
jgi:hypothetical protein